MVSCDHNATTASMEEDVFTLARDKGAVAAASSTSSEVFACLTVYLHFQAFIFLIFFGLCHKS
jgi:hypothetical protein